MLAFNLRVVHAKEATVLPFGGETGIFAFFDIFENSFGRVKSRCGS